MIISKNQFRFAAGITAILATLIVLGYGWMCSIKTDSAVTEWANEQVAAAMCDLEVKISKKIGQNRPERGVEAISTHQMVGRADRVFVTPTILSTK